MKLNGYLLNFEESLKNKSNSTLIDLYSTVLDDITKEKNNGNSRMVINDLLDKLASLEIEIDKRKEG